MAEGDGETVLTFGHSGWAEASPFFAHCSTRWALYLVGLKAGLEGGKASPYPDTTSISTWG